MNQEYLGLKNVFAEKDESDPVLEYVKTIKSVGGYHVLFRQVIGKERIPLFRAYVTVHINKDIQVYMCKSRATPKEILEETDPKSKSKWNDKQTKATVLQWILEENAVKRSKDIPFKRPYPVKQENLRFRPSSLYYRFVYGDAYLCRCIRVSRVTPKEEWKVFVQVDNPEAPVFIKAENDAVAHARKRRKPNPYKKTGQALVFDPNPVTALQGHEKLIRQDLLNPAAKTSRELQERLKPAPEDAYRLVKLESLDKSGYLQGKRVKIKVPRGVRRLKRKDGDFRVWARVPGSSHGSGFEEVMVYFHIDSAIRYLETIGYENELSLFKRPITANVYYTDEDNAWYNGETRQLYFGTGDISEAEDGETIIHELGHAIQDRICPGFGQTNESTAMAEGFSDYLAMSYFYDKKSDAYKKTVMSWDGLHLGLTRNITPPAIRRISQSANYLNDFVNRNGNQHNNGSIWSGALWDIYEAMGRDKADRIIIESHFELSAHTTFSRGARAIIHANRNLFSDENQHESTLKKIFTQRGIDCGY